MSEIVRLRTQAEIDEQAAVWVWRLDEEPLDPQQAQELQTWLRQDPRHRRALGELAGVWGKLDLLGEHAATLATEVPGVPEVTTPPAARSRGAWWAAAAAFLLAAAGALLWLQLRPEAQMLETAVGQHRSVTLADHSVITLNTNSIVQTAFGGRRREVFLRKGEAHFQVAHERWRPFIVHAGQADIRAVGTQFDVRLHTDGTVDVIVDEGRVRVDRLAADGNEAVAATQRWLAAGEELSTREPGLAVQPLPAASLAGQLAWREGAIVFNDEPLGEAIGEIGRYTDLHIVVSDAAVASLPIGGRFRVDDLPGFFAALQSALPVTVHREGNLVYVEARR